MGVNAAELDALSLKYALAGEPDRVDYSRFVAFVDAAFSRGDLSPNTDSTLDVRRHSAAQLSPRTVAAVDEAVVGLARFVAQHRVQLKDMFQDFDRQREETVTLPQLSRVLAVMGVPASAETQELLAKRFTHMRGGSKRFDYVRLLAAMDAINTEPPPAGGAAETKATVVPARSRAPGELAGTVGKTMSDIDLSLEQRLADMKAYISSRRLRTSEFFSDGDPLRKGTISRSRFLSGLARLVPWLSQRGLAEVADAFSVNDALSAGELMVSWKQFEAEMEGVFTVPHLEGTPDCDVEGEVARNLATSSLTRGELLRETRPRTDSRGSQRRTSSGGKTDDSRTLLGRVRELRHTRRLMLQPFFADYDRHRTGRLPASQFLRALSVAFRAGDFSAAELDALAARYVVVQDGAETARPFVNYRAFCSDIDDDESTLSAATDMEGTTVPDSTLHPSRTQVEAAKTQAVPSSEREAELDTLLESLAALALTRRIRVDNFLRDYDPLRHGYVQGPKFLSALDSAFRVDISPALQSALIRRFASDKFDGCVDYPRFIDAVEGRGADPNTPQRTPRRRSLVRFDERRAPVDQAALDQVLAHIAERVTRARLHVKAYFQDYDRHNNGSVTATQFCSVLEFNRLLPATSQTQLLLKAFEMPDAPDRINYVRFCYRVNTEAH